MTARLHLPHSHDAAPGFLSLAWRAALGCLALACCGAFGAAVACLTAYVREHGARGGLYDQLLPKAEQPGTIAMAMDLVEALAAVHEMKPTE